MRILAVALMCTLTTPAFAGQCVEVLLQDATGQMSTQIPPLIGFQIPEAGPVLNQTLEPGTQVYPGKEAPCPPELVAAVQEVFDQNCVSTQGRAAAAQANQKDDATINKRCQNLYQALQAKK